MSTCTFCGKLIYPPKRKFCSVPCQMGWHRVFKDKGSERRIEKYLVKRVKALGGEVRKVKFIGHNGAPDRIVMLPPGVGVSWAHRVVGYCVWVELKATGKKPEPHQLREHERMRAMGQRVEVIDSIEGVNSLLGVG